MLLNFLTDDELLLLCCQCHSNRIGIVRRVHRCICLPSEKVYRGVTENQYEYSCRVISSDLPLLRRVMFMSGSTRITASQDNSSKQSKGNNQSSNRYICLCSPFKVIATCICRYDPLTLSVIPRHNISYSYHVSAFIATRRVAYLQIFFLHSSHCNPSSYSHYFLKIMYNPPLHR